MAKTDTPAQHNILHYLWPNNCCLCGHEAEIAELRRQLDYERDSMPAGLTNRGLIPLRVPKSRCCENPFLVLVEGRTDHTGEDWLWVWRCSNCAARFSTMMAPGAESRAWRLAGVVDDSRYNREKEKKERGE